MSKISTVYDGLITVLGTLYDSTYRRIPLPYDLQANKTIDVEKGYALKYNGEIPAGTQTTTSLGKVYNFSVVFTREMVTMVSDLVPLDDTVKALLEDVATFRLNAYDTTQLNLGTTIEKIDLGQTDGIFPIYDERSNFLSIETFFDIQIREKTLNC